MSIRRELESRWPSKFNTHAMKQHFSNALDLVDRIEGKRIEVKADKRLSEVGHVEQVQAFAATQASALVKARAAVARARSSLEKDRAKLIPTVKDKADISAALLRQEVRSFLRSKSPSEAIQVALNPDADPVIIAAIFEAPSVLSNVTEQSRDHILKGYLENNAAPQIAALREQNEAIGVLEAAVRIAEGAVATAAGVQPATLDRWLAEKAPKETAEAVVAAAQPAAIDPSSVERDALALPFSKRKALIERLQSEPTPLPNWEKFEAAVAAKAS